MFTGPVGPVEVFFYWPKAVLGNFYWPGAIGPLLASGPAGLVVMRNTLMLEHSLYGNESTSCHFLERKGKDVSQIM